MKVGLIGAGFVGATAGYALVLGEVPSEPVFVDVRPEKRVRRWTCRTPRPFRTRCECAHGSSMDLLSKNAAIFREIVPEVVRHAPEATLLVATNPVDVLTEVAALESGLPPTRVIGSGATLDTARLWALLAAYFEQRAERWGAHDEAAVLDEVRRAAYEIIARKQATCYGVASALARIISAIARDERAVLMVSMSAGGVAYVLPQVLGRAGAETTLDVRLIEAERAALDALA